MKQILGLVVNLWQRKYPNILGESQVLHPQINLIIGTSAVLSEDNSEVNRLILCLVIYNKLRTY